MILAITPASANASADADANADATAPPMPHVKEKEDHGTQVFVGRPPARPAARSRARRDALAGLVADPRRGGCSPDD